MPRLRTTPLPGWADLGVPAALSDVLAGATRRVRWAVAPGLRVRRAFAWERPDRTDPAWWPQGITGSADAGRGDRLLLVSWYSRTGAGVRITVLDRATRRYAHLPLALPAADGTLGPLPVHAGGLLWRGSWLHVAATGRGIYSAHLDDLRLLPGGVPVWPVRLHHRPPADDTAGLRYSFLSLTEDGALLAGEYGRGEQSTRLARFRLSEDGLPRTDDDGVATAVGVDLGVPGMQGALCRRGRYLLTVSQGARRPGSLVAGAAGSLREHRYATPVGPEDLTWSDGLAWTVTEHPGDRWIVALKAPRLR